MLKSQTTSHEAIKANAKPVVRLCIENGKDVILVRTIDQKFITKHSKTVRDALMGSEPSAKFKTIHLKDVDQEFFELVLGRLLRDSDNLRINVAHCSITEGIGIWKAVKALQVVPPQENIVKHLTWYVSNVKMRPNEVSAIHNSFGPAYIYPNSSLWTSMAHQLASNFVDDMYSEDECNDLVAECEKWVDLNDTVLARMAFLKEKRRVAEERQARYEARKQVNQERQQAYEERARSREEGARRAHERASRRWEDQQLGLLPLGEADAARLMDRSEN